MVLYYLRNIDCVSFLQSNKHVGQIPQFNRRVIPPERWHRQECLPFAGTTNIIPGRTGQIRRHNEGHQEHEKRFDRYVDLLRSVTLGLISTAHTLVEILVVMSRVSYAQTRFKYVGVDVR